MASRHKVEGHWHSITNDHSFNYEHSLTFLCLDAKKVTKKNQARPAEHRSDGANPMAPPVLPCQRLPLCWSDYKF